MNRASFDKLREQLLSPLVLHGILASLLLVLVLVLGVRFVLDWSAASDRSTAELTAKQVSLRALQLKNAPLSGIDERLAQSRASMAEFYQRRIPLNYSAVSIRLGELALKAPVRLSRVQYSQGAKGAELSEIVLDAGITGEYPQIAHFINSIERDPDFFVIRSMALTGQQGGMVNLRIRLSTWLRPADAAALNLPPVTPVQEENGKPSPAILAGKEAR